RTIAKTANLKDSTVVSEAINGAESHERVPQNGTPVITHSERNHKTSRFSKHRAFNTPLRTSKFWLRIFRPWKWRKRAHRKSRNRRSGSDGSRTPENGHNNEKIKNSKISSGTFVDEPTTSVNISNSHTVSAIEPPQKTQLHNTEATDLSVAQPTNALCSPVGTPAEVSRAPSLTVLSSCQSRPLVAPTIFLKTEEIDVPKVHKVLIIDSDKENTIYSTEAENSPLTSPRSPPVVLRLGLQKSLAEQSPTGPLTCEINATTPSEEFVRSQVMDFLNGSPKRAAPVFEEIPAKEPDLAKKPIKPVLRRPREKRSEKRNSALKNTNGNANPGPSRLTDDSDSDSDIKYRSDDDDQVFMPKASSYENTKSRPINKWGSIHSNDGLPHSTNPAISSKIVPSLSRSGSVDSDEEEENIASYSAWAKRVQRRDTLAKKLDAPEPVDDIPNQSKEERVRLMHRVSIKLERKLSERPTADELEQRNILKDEEAESITKRTMEETRKMLLRKLSFRPTIQELKDKQIIQFSDYVEVTEAEIYDRKADKPWTRLTPFDKAQIRKELNDFKATEMNVHEESKIFTRFHRP
uniref:Phosphatase and actin regulator n=1 Tax=Acrobeloides nanus TaxID=290746 RepID=A0A914E247_9BILA